jgi:hypothetical protein
MGYAELIEILQDRLAEKQAEASVVRTKRSAVRENHPS